MIKRGSIGNLKESSVERLIVVVFGLLGLVFVIVAGSHFFISGKEAGSYLPTKAEVTDIFRERDSYDKSKMTAYTQIEFKADNKTVKTEINQYNSLWNIGDKIDIYYHKENPFKVKWKFFDTFFIAVFGGLGSIFIIIAISFYSYTTKGVRKKKRLLKTGSIIEAEVMNIKLNTRITVNGRNPLKLECHYKAYDGTIHIFYSENIWEYFGEEIIGTLVKVYIDKNNYNDYYIDSSKLKASSSYKIIEHK